MISILMSDESKLIIKISESLDITKVRKIIRKAERMYMSQKAESIIIDINATHKIKRSAYPLIKKKIKMIKTIPVIITSN